MAIREIITDNVEFLTKKSRPVTEFNERLEILVGDMIETLSISCGVGLAAPQIGVLRRIFVIDTTLDSNYKVFVNPEIISKQGKNDAYVEGCLSFPDRSFQITRPQTVVVKAYDVKGNAFTFEGEDFIARALIHEHNHLDGILLPMIGKEIFKN